MMQENIAVSKKFIPALGYKWLSGFYDLTFKLALPENKLRNKLIEELDLKDGESILEFGYGTGQNLVFAYRKNKNIKLTGIDIDPSIRKIASYKINKYKIPVSLDLYDGKTFPYSDNSFDKVYSSLVFHHLDTETKINCLKEINRILKPGGKLIIGDFGKAKTKLMRFVYYSVQLLDGFKTTEENVLGLIPKFISETNFINIKETGFINTVIGTYSYYFTEKSGIKI